LLISVMRHGLAVAGRFLVLRTRVPDRPGELARLLTMLAEERVNVVEVEHQREGAGLPVAETGVELTLLTRDPAHCDEIVETMQRLGYSAERLT
jgi:threonine dehydratase